MIKCVLKYGDTLPIEFEFENDYFFWGKAEYQSTRRKVSGDKGENQQQTQAPYDAESGNQTRATVPSRFPHD